MAALIRLNISPESKSDAYPMSRAIWPAEALRHAEPCCSTRPRTQRDHVPREKDAILRGNSWLTLPPRGYPQL